METLRRGGKDHIRGFIMNKCYEHHCWAKPGGDPKKHHSITDMKKGYSRSHWGKFGKIIKKLRSEKLILVFPHGTENHVCAILYDETVLKGIEIANKWRVAEGLKPFPSDLEVFLKML